MIETTVADKVDQLAIKLAKGGQGEKALEVGLHWSKINDLVQKEFPTELIILSLMGGFDSVRRSSEASRQELYDRLIKPYERFV